MLLVASWPIAYVLAPCLTTEVVEVSYHHDVTRGRVRDALLISDPLIGSTPTTKMELLPLWTDAWAWKDSWGRPLQILEDKDGKLRRNGRDLLVYSTGFDGKSNSNGNDADDINSWDDHHLKFYHSQITADERAKYLWRSAWATPIVFAIIYSLLAFAGCNPGQRR